MAALYAKRVASNDGDDSSLNLRDASDDSSSDDSSSDGGESDDPPGAMVHVDDAWAAEPANLPARCLRRITDDRFVRRFYRRARATFGDATWHFSRG